MNTNSNSRSYNDVIDNLQKVPPGKSLQAIETANGSVKVLSSATMYVTGTTAELSTRNGSLIKPGLEPEPGVTNFELANKLPKGQYMRIVAERFLFETGVGKTQADAAWKSEAPVNWKNSDFELSQNGDGRLFKSPITDMTNFRASTGNDDDFRYHEPVVIRPEVLFDPKVTLAPAADVTNQLWRWECRVEIVQDANS